MTGRKIMLFGTVAAMLATPVLAETVSTADYLAKAGAGDLFERRASLEVLQSTKSADIRRFAQAMIADHARSTAMVRAAAVRSGLQPIPPELSSKQLRMLADLKEVKGTRRDQVYVDQQKAAHAEALKLQQDYALSGDMPQVQAAAAKIVPVVQSHMKMLDAMHP